MVLINKNNYDNNNSGSSNNKSLTLHNCVLLTKYFSEILAIILLF